MKREGATGATAASLLAEDIADQVDTTERIIVVGAAKKDSENFARTAAKVLREKGFSQIVEVIGTPRDLRQAWDGAKGNGALPAVIVVSGDVIKWTVLPSLQEEASDLEVMMPRERLTSDFLKRTNLLAIVDRIVVIAVIAIGMTLVILTGGIDLSVGSLIALSAVIGTLVMKAMGGLEAPWWVVWVASSSQPSVAD